MKLKNIELKNKIRISEIQTINIDLYEEISKNSLNIVRFNKFIDNLKKTGPIFICLFLNLFHRKYILNQILKNDNNLNLNKIKNIKNYPIIDINIIKNTINNEVSHLIKNNNLIFLKNELLFEIYKHQNFIIKIKNNEYHNILKKDEGIIQYIPNLINSSEKIILNNIIDIEKVFNELEIKSNFKKELFQMLSFEKNINNLKILDNLYISNNILIRSIENCINILQIKNLKIIQIKLFILFLNMISIYKINTDFHFNNIYLDKSNNFYFLDYSNILFLDDSSKFTLKVILNLILNYNNLDHFLNNFLKHSLINKSKNQINNVIKNFKKDLNLNKNINIVEVLIHLKNYFSKHLSLIDNKIYVIIDILIYIENNNYQNNSTNIFVDIKKYIQDNKIIV